MTRAERIVSWWLALVIAVALGVVAVALLVVGILAS